MSLVAMVAALAACNNTKNPDDDPSGDKVEPARIAFAEAFTEFFMNKGETIALSYTVSPAGVNVPYNLVWKSSDEDVATVNDKGEVTAVKTGEVTITVSIKEYEDVAPARSNITVLNPIKVGDFLYSDGSWGNSTIGKDIIAMVYWLGNPTLFDPILEAEYPNCTHGLAMSLKQGKVGQWQQGYTERMFGKGGDLNEMAENAGTAAWCAGDAGMAEWGMLHSNYGELIKPYLEEGTLAGMGFCGVGGYTYTYVMDEFMKTDPGAATYPLDIYNNTMALVEGIEHPATTSEWYIPSLFEAGLMVNTALTKPSDFDKPDSVFQHNHQNVAVLNAMLGTLTGADKLPTTGAIATASDMVFPAGSILPLKCADFFEFIVVASFAPKTQEEYDKLSDAEKTKYNEEKEKANAAYKKWMESNGMEWKEEYAEDSNYTRAERYLTFKGYEYNKEKVDNIYLGGALTIWIAMMVNIAYANVDVETGKSAYVNPMYTGGKAISGAKGYDNPNDVVRAVIAF